MSTYVLWSIMLDSVIYSWPVFLFPPLIFTDNCRSEKGDHFIISNFTLYAFKATARQGFLEACTLICNIHVTAQRGEGVCAHIAAHGRAVVKFEHFTLQSSGGICSSIDNVGLSESNGFLFFLYLVKCSESSPFWEAISSSTTWTEGRGCCL